VQIFEVDLFKIS